MEKFKPIIIGAISMKQRWKIIITSALTIAILLFILLNQTTAPVITYFPNDPSLKYDRSNTSISIKESTGDDTYIVDWESYSSLSDPVYLRQDVSILFMDGRLKGMKSIWKEQEKNIHLSSSFEESDSSLFQAITFHHGEIHYSSDDIKTVQSMSSSKVYVIDSPHTKLVSFAKPVTDNEKDWSSTVDQTINQYLHYVWNEWITEKSINIEEYDLVQLVDLIHFNDQTLPDLTEEQTNKVIGQLWEGLYKNYVIPMLNKQWKDGTPMPIVLFSKDNTHLIVVFEDGDQQVQVLYQQYTF